MAFPFAKFFSCEELECVLALALSHPNGLQASVDRPGVSPCTLLNITKQWGESEQWFMRMPTGPHERKVRDTEFWRNATTGCATGNHVRIHFRWEVEPSVPAIACRNVQNYCINKSYWLNNRSSPMTPCLLCTKCPRVCFSLLSPKIKYLLHFRFLQTNLSPSSERSNIQKPEIDHFARLWRGRVWWARKVFRRCGKFPYGLKTGNGRKRVRWSFWWDKVTIVVVTKYQALFTVALLCKNLEALVKTDITMKLFWNNFTIW